MMPVTIDPSETRRPAPPVARPPRAGLRLVLLSGLGVLGLAGFTALASSVLGGLAGPQFVRPTLKSAASTQSASDWPDLRDGVPALAPVKPVTDRASAKPISETVSATPEPDRTVAATASTARPSAAMPLAAMPVPPAPPAPVVASSPAATPAALTQAAKPAEAAAAPKPARLPPIENATVLPPARPASLVPATRTATLVAPSPAETTRSRATPGTFTALPPEPEASKRKTVVTAPQPTIKPPAAQAAKPAHAAKPPVPKVASATAPEPQAAEAEPEHTEVFGLKVPSLAPAGRKLAEGVEALGNAVKSFPDRF